MGEGRGEDSCVDFWFGIECAATRSSVERVHRRGLGAVGRVLAAASACARGWRRPRVGPRDWESEGGGGGGRSPPPESPLRRQLGEQEREGEEGAGGA
jgi:hypothetical protein